MTPAVCSQLVHDFARSALAPKLRSMREFAEQEIVIPGGPFAGRKFKTAFQPFTALWFDAIAADQFSRYVATGCTQSGKTLACHVIPIMFHLFERKETVILGAPSLDICEDKWLVDILPTIQRSRFADLLPRTGKGSSGAFNDLLTFRNGARLKSMSGRASDSGNAAFTARVACLTEVDGMDTASDASRESDPVNRIAGRLRAYGSLARMYLECTVSVETGRIWRELQSGTCSQIVVQCDSCREWVSPERADFVGWDGAESELQAEQLGRFSCPQCGILWRPDQRIQMNNGAKLIHRGQSVDETGQVIGPVPETRTMSMRWSAFNNLFSTEQQLGAEEWSSAREIDQDNAEKARCQQVWTVPYSASHESTDLTADTVSTRLTGLDEFTVPDDTETLVAQIDVHNRWHYYTVMATSAGNVRSIPAYGLWLTPNPQIIGDHQAIRLGLSQLADHLESLPFKTVSGRSYPIDHVGVDVGFEEWICLEFIRERNAMCTGSGNPLRYVPTKGKGSDYRQPTKADADAIPGDHWYFSRQSASAESGNKQWWLAIVAKNHFLRLVHSGFGATSIVESGARRPGSIAIFGTEAQKHLTPVDKTVARSSYAVQILGQRFGEIKTSKGTQFGWSPAYKEDHWLDTTYGCFAADLVCRYIHPRFKPKRIAPAGQIKDRPRFTMPDGRPYFLTER